MDQDLKLQTIQGMPSSRGGLGDGADELKHILEQATEHLHCSMACPLMPVIINQTASNNLFDSLPHRILLCPLRVASGRTTGMLALFRDERGEFFTDSDSRLGDTLSRKIVGVIDSHYDALTWQVRASPYCRTGRPRRSHHKPARSERIRLIFPAAATAAAASSSLFPILQPSRPLRILFVDDDPIMLKSVRDTLEQDGHAVVIAQGGERGIEAFHAAKQRNEPFAVVITDLGMPHVDGRRIAAAIKSAAPKIPVILLTGWGHRLLAENDTPPSVDRVLSKPPKLAVLRLALAELTGEQVS